MLLFFSCTADNYERITPSVVKSARKFDVSFSDVSSHIKHRRGTETKSGSCSIEPIVSGHDTLFYLVNYDRGWELLSADTRAAQVIAFAEDGHMSVDSLFPGPSAQALYSNIFNQLLYLKSNPGFVEASLSAGGWENEINNNIGDSDELMFADTILYVNLYQDHLTVTRWGQDYPWNMRAPYTNSSLSTHCKTGCVPVAAA